MSEKLKSDANPHFNRPTVRKRDIIRQNSPVKNGQCNVRAAILRRWRPAPCKNRCSCRRCPFEILSAIFTSQINPGFWNFDIIRQIILSKYPPNRDLRDYPPYYYLRNYPPDLFYEKLSAIEKLQKRPEISGFRLIKDDFGRNKSWIAICRNIIGPFRAFIYSFQSSLRSCKLFCLCKIDLLLFRLYV